MPNDKEFELDDLESFSFDDLSLDEDPPKSEGKPGEDPLGVWVKSAPEDVDAMAEELPSDLPTDAPAAADDLPEEDFLSSEELANLDDSFEFVTVEEPMEGEAPLDDEVAFLDTPEAIEAEKMSADSDLPSFDEISLDDFVSFDDKSTPDAGAVVRSSAGPALEAASSEDDFNEEFLDIDIDIDDEIGDEQLEIVEGGSPKPAPQVAESANFPSEEVDLAEFGDFEEVTPKTSSPLGGMEDLPEMSDLPDMASLEDDPFLDEDEGSFEEEVFDEPMAALQEEGPVALDLEPDDQTDMEHILALEEDLTSGIRESDAAPAAGTDLAAQILGKIEQELSSIKREISDLKKEFNTMKTAPQAAPAAEAPVFESEEAGEDADAPKSHGFFDEEDDETIALTGDELDNILSTAEISVEDESGESMDEDLLSLDAEGNLVENSPAAEEPAGEEVHVTDEEFLSGTALADDDLAGVPESIELEESLPDELDAAETEDLLSESDIDFDVDPLPAGMLEGKGEALELPSDEELGLELADAGTLAPDLADEAGFSPDLVDESLQIDLGSSDPEGWSPPPDEPMPTPPPVTFTPPAPTPGAVTPLPSGLKDELRAVLTYMDKLLASLPDDKIQEFAESDHFEVYKRLFEELGLIE